MTLRTIWDWLAVPVAVAAFFYITQIVIPYFAGESRHVIMINGMDVTPPCPPPIWECPR